LLSLSTTSLLSLSTTSFTLSPSLLSFSLAGRASQDFEVSASSPFAQFIPFNRSIFFYLHLLSVYTFLFIF